MEPGQELPPPSLLKRKIIIKNKKKHHHHHHHKKNQKKQQIQIGNIEEGTEPTDENSSESQSTRGENGPPPDVIPQAEVADNGNGEFQISNEEVHPPMLQQRQGSKDSTQDDDGKSVFFILLKITFLK